MSLTLPGWLLIVSSIAISALLFFPLRSRLALLSGLHSSNRRLGHLQGVAGMSIVAAAAFLLVAGVGGALSYLRDAPGAASSRDTISSLHSGPDAEALARLQNYTRSIGAEEPAPMSAAGKALPDVDTMIERLAARLETAPEDVKGWRMLGWSYYHTERYEQAAAAYARAVALDPSSAELKLSYEEAKAKASEATPAPEQDAAIRSMVDGLADRLERSPRDVDGWARLMRSRVVLGEREVAVTAFRQALEVFKDDATAMGTITAVAGELGLKSQ